MRATFLAQHWGHGFDADSAGNVYSGGGYTGALATTENAANRSPGHSVLSKFSLRPATGPTLRALANAASGDAESQPKVAPGEIISLFGAGLGPKEGASFDASGAPTTLAGTTVLIDDRPIPLLYTGECQVNAVVPLGLQAGRQSTLRVKTPGGAGTLSTIRVVPTLVGLFRVGEPKTITVGGRTVLGRAAAVNEDGTLNSPENPAAPGSVISLFATGLGVLSPMPPDGSVVGTTPPFPQANPDFLVTVLAMNLSFSSAKVLYAGAAPGAITGLIQINLRLPQDVSAGDRVPIFVFPRRYPSGLDGASVSISAQRAARPEAPRNLRKSR